MYSVQLINDGRFSAEVLFVQLALRLRPKCCSWAIDLDAPLGPVWVAAELVRTPPIGAT